MVNMAETHSIKQWLIDKFLEWQAQSGEIKSQREFADYLGVGNTSLSNWISGYRLPTGENIARLASKLGPEIYDQLGLARPDPDLQAIVQNWEHLSPKERRQFVDIVVKKAEEATEPSASPIPDNEEAVTQELIELASTLDDDSLEILILVAQKLLEGEQKVKQSVKRFADRLRKPIDKPN